MLENTSKRAQLNLFKRDDKIEAYTLKDGTANFLNIGYKHAVINMSNTPRIALMFTLNGTKDIQKLAFLNIFWWFT